MGRSERQQQRGEVGHRRPKGRMPTEHYRFWNAVRPKILILFIFFHEKGFH
jgi:hypothetical protein